VLLFLEGYNVGGASEFAVAWFHPRVDRHERWGALFSLLGYFHFRRVAASVKWATEALAFPAILSTRVVRAVLALV